MNQSTLQRYSDIDYSKGKIFKNYEDCLNCVFYHKTSKEKLEFLKKLPINDLEILRDTKYVSAKHHGATVNYARQHWNKWSEIYTKAIRNDNIAFEEVANKAMNHFQKIMNQQERPKSIEYLEACMCTIVLNQRLGITNEQMTDAEKLRYKHLDWNEIEKILDKNDYFEDLNRTKIDEKV